jgi:hypothetical protein
LVFQFLSFPYRKQRGIAKSCCRKGMGWLTAELVVNDPCTWYVAGSAAAGPGAVNGVANLLGGLAMGPSPSQATAPPNLLGAGGGLPPHPMAPTNLGGPGATFYGGSARGLGSGPFLGPSMAGGGPAFAGPAGGVHMGAHGIYPAAPGIGAQSGYSAMPYMQQALGPQGGYGGTAVLGTGMPYGAALPAQGVSSYGGLASTNPGGRAPTMKVRCSNSAACQAL